MNDLGVKSSWYYECDAKEFRESELMRKVIRSEQHTHKETVLELSDSI